MIINQPAARPLAAGLRFNPFGPPLFLFLAVKELWRYRGRYFLVSLVIALITTLVLFIAGLAEGLGAGNKEYLDKLNADLILYQAGVDLSIPSSQLNHALLNNVRRVDGVKAVGSIGFSNAALVFENGREPLDVSLIGVDPGKPGEPPVILGRQLESRRAKTAIIDNGVAVRTGLAVGDTFTLKSIQDAKEEFYTLTVSGITTSRQYSIQPSIFVPHLTWDRLKPQASRNDPAAELIYNTIAVQLNQPVNGEPMARRLESQVRDIQAVDRRTAYENTPGYSAQQSTLNTQRIFTMLIGVLVVGGFFQIQTLQKVAQIGMLKAIGVSNISIVLAFIVQIVAITALGVVIGSGGTLLLSLSFPVTIPIVFTPQSVVVAVASLLLIGPLGGLVSLRILLKVEPLTALGLAS